MVKKILSSISIVILIVAVTIGVILYAKGYRINLDDKKFSSHGVLSVSSYPEKASIFINGKLTSATNASITLIPGIYDIKVTKEGYQHWEKKLNIKKEEVSQADALLIPSNPSLKSVTTSGLKNPSTSPSGTKIAYIFNEEIATASPELKSKNGVWLIDLKGGPLSSKYEPRQLFVSTPKYDLENSELVWAPDEKSLALVFYTPQLNAKSPKKIQLVYRLLNDSNVSLEDITLSYPKLTEEWEIYRLAKLEQRLSVLPENLSTLLIEKTTSLSFSPDDTKIIYEATSSAQIPTVISPPLAGVNPAKETRNIEKDKIYIYDIKEDRNYLVLQKKDLGEVKPQWYSDSKHITFVEKDSVYFIDYDATNMRPVYSGPFENNFLAPLPGENKIAILTSFNKPNSLPNLYEIDLR